MSKIPFKVFPTNGYKNSQFQIISYIDNLRIEIIHKGVVIKNITINPNKPTLINKFSEAGEYIVKSIEDKSFYKQTINVRESYRLGSSELKKTYVFDDVEYSFFLMKDRLLFYDNNKRFMFTENDISPSDIKKIDKNNLLFITHIGEKDNGITNFGVYNLLTFSITGELLDLYVEIVVDLQNKFLWVYNKVQSSIHCFIINDSNDEVFKEIKKYDEIIEFTYNEKNKLLFIAKKDQIITVQTNNLKEFNMLKHSSKAIDINGYYYEIVNGKINCLKIFNDFKASIKLPPKLNIDETDFFFLGDKYTYKSPLLSFNSIVEDIIKCETNKISFNDNKEKTFDRVYISDDINICENIVQHKFYPTIKGFFLLKKEIKNQLKYLQFEKNNNWNGTTYINTSTVKQSLLFVEEGSFNPIIEDASDFKIISFDNHYLIVEYNNNLLVACGNEIISFENVDDFNLFTIDSNNFLLVENKGLHSLYLFSDIKKALLKDVEIHNSKFLEQHKVIWYSQNKKKVENNNIRLKIFDLSSLNNIYFSEKHPQLRFLSNFRNYKFYENYILSSNNVIINPVNGKIFGSVIGRINSISKQLNKVISERDGFFYLSEFNKGDNVYEDIEINLIEKKIIESYLSPNGKFLVLKEEAKNYVFYDIEKDEEINFISGNFLAFSKDGNIIIEEDQRRTNKIIDPLTFEDVTPPNYKYYRFLSPDGKLYADIILKTRYINKLVDTEISLEERNEIDKKIHKNKDKFFTINEINLKKINIDNPSEISIDKIIKAEKYTKIGIVETNEEVEIVFPDDLDFYNYSAFSFDNKYYGYVGKPSRKGIICIYKIDFDSYNNKLSIIDYYIDECPENATWICSFSKTGYFATYDSVPKTYLAKIDDEFLLNLKVDSFQNNQYVKKECQENWNVIDNKNFLCFSPTGSYLALSEQGYIPLSLGGTGHQESSAIHIALTKTGELINSYFEHGAEIQKDRKLNNITFVSFSEDENRLMSLSSDGVVIIRDLELTT